MNNPTPLKQAMLERFGEIELDTDQMRTLVDRQTTMVSQQPDRPVRAGWLQFGAAAAIVLTLISVWFTGQWYAAREGNRLMVAIADEVAANHLKLKPLEVEGSDLDSVFGYFRDLDFRLVATPRLGGIDRELLGGRYCSIQGIAAAQLRYREPDGDLSTWYEGMLPSAQLSLLPSIERGQTPAEFYVRGIRVDIWTEHGVVFAAARSVRP